MSEETTVQALRTLFDRIIEDLKSHHEALRRLTENQAAAHAKLVELGEVVNTHTRLFQTLAPPDPPSVN